MEHGTKNPNYMHNWSMQKLYQAFFDLLLVPTNATASFCPAYAWLIFNVTQCIAQHHPGKVLGQKNENLKKTNFF